MLPSEKASGGAPAMDLRYLLCPSEIGGDVSMHHPSAATNIGISPTILTLRSEAACLTRSHCLKTSIVLPVRVSFLLRVLFGLFLTIWSFSVQDLEEVLPAVDIVLLKSAKQRPVLNPMFGFDPFFYDSGFLIDEIFCSLIDRGIFQS